MTNIRKLLGGISFFAVLLLNQPTTWAQSFGDDIKEQADNCHPPKPWKVEFIGSPTNDYTLTPPNKNFKCTIPTTKVIHSFSLSAHAALGTGLGIFGSSAAAGQAASDGTTVTANDTLILSPPVGFNGTSVNIGLKETYNLQLQGASSPNAGSAIACFQWTGQQTPVCFPLTTNGTVQQTLTVPRIVMNKTDQGFQLNLSLSGVAGVTTITGGHMFAQVSIGSPTITVPQGWTFTWASGEP